MRALAPQDLTRLFLDGLNAADVDAITSLYEPDGVIATDSTHGHQGHAAIRQMLFELLADPPRFAVEESDVVQSGSLALVRSRWTISSPAVGGSSSQMRVTALLVARRQPEGHWLVAIDQPSIEGSETD